MSLAERTATRLSAALAARTSRRGFLVRSALAGAALAAAPRTFVLRPVTAYDSICGPSSTCDGGFSVFCCTINGGVNACPPGSFAAGWWKADGASLCCGGPRYYIDCNASCSRCTSGCAGGPFCSSSCWSCGCRCSGGSTCDQRRVCCNVFRYGQCHPEIGCSGPVQCRVVSCVPPYRLSTACSSASATDNSTVAHSAPCLPTACTAISRHYDALGGAGSFLGPTVGAEFAVSGGLGQVYVGGRQYYSSSTGAHEVHGALMDLYVHIGGPASYLGFPTADTAPTPDTVGRVSRFHGGAIYAHPTFGAHEVHGAIYDEYLRVGQTGSQLGYPVASTAPTPDGVGRVSRFQFGAIYAHPTLGAHEVHGAIYDEYARLGQTAGRLGYPVSDVHTVRRLRRSDFVHGFITYDRATGRVRVHFA